MFANYLYIICKKLNGRDNTRSNDRIMFRVNKISLSLYRSAFIKNNARMKHTMIENFKNKEWDELKIINTAGIVGAVLGSWAGACVTYSNHKNEKYMQCVVMTTSGGMMGAWTGFMVSSMMPILVPISISIVVGTTIARQLEPTEDVSSKEDYTQYIYRGRR